MRLGKILGRVGFVFGFSGPLLFYAVPLQFFQYVGHVLCPWCPNVDILFTTPLTWLEIGLKVGLLSGLILALFGFAFGWTISKAFQMRVKRSESGTNS